MFYSQFILAKKGPLGTIWIAAHLERKLRKNQVADTDIGVSVDSILFPDVPIALRLSSHLLLGVVRIYSRKVNYLFDDCSEALLKIKQAFRSTAVDLPPEESTAPYHSITLPETFDLDDFELPDNDMFQGNYVDHHVSTREQITLQDTMEGVVFSTSQFGLDERFGDGDTSQIGLDIDEDLFLRKVAARGNDGDPDGYPLTSALPMTPGEKDEMLEGGTSAMMQDDGVDDQNEIPAANIEAHEHAQSLFSPAVECPSPLDVQETLACDGPMGSKDLELKESEAVECTENGNRMSDAHEMVPISKENGYLLGDVEMKEPKYQVHSASVEVTRENMPEDNGLSTPSSVMVEHAEALPLVPECSNGHISAVDGPDMHNNNEPGANLIDRTDAESPSCSQVTTELEDPGRRTCSVDVEFQNNMGESCSPSNKMSSNVCMPESPDRPEVVNVEAQTFREPKETDTLNHSPHEHIPSADLPGLRACNTLKQTDVPSSRGEESQSTDAVELESEKRHLSEPALCGETPDDCRKLDDEIDNAPSCDNQLENVEGSAASNFPAPEKLLSVSEGLVSKPNDLLLETTPEKEILGDDDGDAGDNLMSGKKRSFTESTLTIHSLNSGESFSMNKSRRTAESIPGDDDLLSSILVGRKSSVLKMKPTPPAPEITSTKRLRSAPRASASKRKVLMDDMMVLHGDTIRQQLTNTEDIRRLRKKAPCTRPEISMIQRQFLEEEIFSEPIFTGMSAELVSLHSETFDFSRIKVTENDQDDAPVELAKDKESSNVVRNDMETQNDDICIQKESAEISDVRSQQETSKEDAEMDIDGQNIEVSGFADHDVHGPELSLPNDPVSNDFAQGIPADILQPNIVDKDNNEDPSGQIDASPQRFDTEPAEGTSLADIGSERVDGIEVIENGAEVGIDIDKDNGNVHASFETASLETGGCDNMTSGIGNQSVEEIENNSLSIVNPDEVHASGLGCGEKDLTSFSVLGEGAVADSSFYLEPDMNVENAPLDKGVNEDFKEADLPCAANAENTAENSAIEFLGDFEDGAVGNDTEFLNVDDDEVAEDDEDYMPGAEDTRLPENSGWSSRTRAVSKYLQTLFDKESQHGRRVLAMDNLLMGKTRKEASRMFFETLVLKTKDYIHVEQARPFDNINIKPRIKLMKSDF